MKRIDYMAKKCDIDEALKNNLKMEFDKKAIKELGKLIEDWIDFGLFRKAVLTTTKDKVIIILEE